MIELRRWWRSDVGAMRGRAANKATVALRCAAAAVARRRRKVGEEMRARERTSERWAC